MFEHALTLRKEPHTLADILPWYALVGPRQDVSLTKRHDLMRCIRFRGIDTDSMSAEQHVVYYEQINSIFRQLVTGWTVWIEGQHRASCPYPESKWPDLISHLVDEERRTAFSEKVGRSFETDYYLTLLWRLPSETTQRLENLLFTAPDGQDETRVDIGQMVMLFDQAVDSVCDRLRPLLAEVEPLGPEGLLDYLHSTISLKAQAVVAVPEDVLFLDTLLSDQPFSGGIYPSLGEGDEKQHLRLLGIKTFAPDVCPAMFRQLEQLPFPFRYTWRWECLDKVDGLKVLNGYRDRWTFGRKSIVQWAHEAWSGRPAEKINLAADANADEVRQAIMEVERDEASYGYGTFTVCTWDHDPKVSDAKLAQVDALLSGIGFICHRETLNATPAWLGMVPGNTRDNPRRPPIKSSWLSRLCPGMSSAWSGPEKDEHLNAPPVLTGFTTDSQPFRLVLNQNAVGHAMVIGPMRSGKTVLLNLLAQQFRRYPGARVYLFDRDQGFYVNSLAANGSYYTLTPDGGGMSLQPLSRIHLADEQSWAVEWVETLIVTQRNSALQPEERAEILRAIRVLAESPDEHRTMTGLVDHLQDRALREALKPYTLEGAYPLFDGDNDQIAGSTWDAFEMAGMLDLPQACGPALLYLLHCIERGLDGRPTLILIDEAWKVLSHAQFAEAIRAYLKRLPKFNASVVLATQSLGDVLDSKIGHDIVQGCPTRIYLPNRSATDPDVMELYRQVGLSETQIHQIALATPKEYYYYTSPQGSRMFSLGIGPVQDALFGSGYREDIQEAEQILASGEPFAAAWLRRCGVEWAAEAVGQEIFVDGG